ncbi:endonuclease/exonuclease/phosphatase family protein [Streptomyces murinus]|uniref:endonuclease/exonuclease/phosphatase family protein n=1 Tax=Streptomyces murinus TaxID=33900 RepID=UPI0038296CA9
MSITTLAPVPARFLTWNLLLGGLNNGDDTRLRKQTEVVAGLEPDFVVFTECAGWEKGDELLLLRTADALGLTPVLMARSRVNREPKDVINHTVMMYRQSRFRLKGRCLLAPQDAHHAIIRGRFQPNAAEFNDQRYDVYVLGTHLGHADGNKRLSNAKWMTDYAGEFPGCPDQAVALGDFNTPNRVLKDWSRIPQNMHARYRLVNPDGTFGGVDQRALQIMYQSGWQDPETLTGKPRAATVGYAYDNERVPWSLDHILVTKAVQVRDYVTLDTEDLRDLSDHLPTICDVMLGANL